MGGGNSALLIPVSCFLSLIRTCKGNCKIKELVSVCVWGGSLTIMSVVFHHEA